MSGVFVGLFLLLATSAVTATAGTESPAVALVPQPVRVTMTGGAFTLGPKTVLLVSAGPGVRPVAEMLARRLRAVTGYPLPIVASGVGNMARRDAITLTTALADARLGPEGYDLTARPAGVIIRAPRPAGLFYGTQTLRQLLPPPIESRLPPPGVAWRVPGVRIWDWPRFPCAA